jgi:hypothetical protein
LHSPTTEGFVRARLEAGRLLTVVLMLGSDNHGGSMISNVFGG